MANRGLRQYAVAILMFAVVVLFACHGGTPSEVGPQRLGNGSAIAAAANMTSIEGKVKLIWCLAGYCDYFGHGVQDCFCCGDPYQPKNCYTTAEECKAKCPACNPKCPT